MITKLLILSLMLGLILPSFTSQVYAADFLLDEYILNESNDDWLVGYVNTSNKTNSGRMVFYTGSSLEVGELKYIILYDNNANYTDDDHNYTYNATDEGYFGGIDIPLSPQESDWNKYISEYDEDRAFTGFSFLQNRLEWNFSEKPASNRLYIITDASGQRIPVYFLGGYNTGQSKNWNYPGSGKPEKSKVPYVTSQDISNVNASLNQLYELVDTIENSTADNTVEIGGYYPEQAELLKGVACDVKQILQRETSVTYDKNYLLSTDFDEWDAITDTKNWKYYWQSGLYSKSMFQGMKTIIDGYIDYVNTHKISKPLIISAEIDKKSVRIDNTNHKIIINGSAEDYKDKSLEELKFKLPEGIRGSWDADSTFVSENLTYHVMPYNENLGTDKLEEYQNLGVDYTVEFEQFFEPVIEISPSGLTGADVTKTPNTDSSTKKTTYDITAMSRMESVTDADGNHYAFSHWEVDEDNRATLESAVRSSDASVRMLHGSTSIIERFVMPSRALTITAKYAPAYRINTENVGLGEGTTFELRTSGQALRGWNISDSDIELFYYDRDVPSGYIVKNIQVTDANEQVIKTIPEKRSDINYIRFKMPSSAAKVTVTFEKDLDDQRKLVIGKASDTLIAGKGGTVTYELTAEGYSEDATFTVVESYNTGIAKDPETEGLTVALGKVTDGKGTITVTVAPEVAADEYYFCVTPSEGKLLPVGTITVLPADTKMLKAEDASITLKENESGEVKIKGSSMNLSAGASVEAFETDQDGQIKYSGKTEGLTFDKAVLNNDAFTLTAHVSKTVAKGEYYFIVKADNEQSTVAKLTVDREKAETPDQPDQPEKETQKITVTSNASQGSIQIKVAGGSEELISGTGTVKAVEGDTVTVTAMPKDGYKLSVWKITQGMKDVALSSGSLSDTSVSFVMPAASGSDTVTVGATFDKTSADQVVTSDPKITAFSVANVSGTIDQNSGTITVVVPNGTDVTSLCPAIAISDADSVTPASGAVVDFTNAVTYTVKNASGVQKSYVVTVKVQEASVSDTLWDKITSPEGDRSWWKKADSIKSHKKNKYPKYW